MLLSREELAEVMKIANKCSYNGRKFKTVDELNPDIISHALRTYARGCSKDKVIGICDTTLYCLANNESETEGFLLSEDALYSNYFIFNYMWKGETNSHSLPIHGISQITSSDSANRYLNIFYKDGSIREIVDNNTFKDMVGTLLTEIMKKENWKYPMLLNREGLTEAMKIANKCSYNGRKFKTVDELNPDIISHALRTYARGCSRDKVIGICDTTLYCLANNESGAEGFLLSEDALYSNYFIFNYMCKGETNSHGLPIHGISQITSSDSANRYLNVFYKDGSIREKVDNNIFKDMVGTLLTEIMKKEKQKEGEKKKEEGLEIPEQEAPEHADYELNFLVFLKRVGF